VFLVDWKHNFADHMLTNYGLCLNMTPTAFWGHSFTITCHSGKLITHNASTPERLKVMAHALTTLLKVRRHLGGSVMRARRDLL